MTAIKFGTDGWRATLDAFTTPRVRRVAQGVASHLVDTDASGGVAVGYDARESSPGFADDASEVLRQNGFDVVLPERDCPTPVLAWAIVDRGLSGGLMITASHNPPNYNGIKFIPANGAPAPEAVTDAIEARLADPDPRPEAEWGDTTTVDMQTPHADHALALADCDLNGLRVAYDAMHGSGRGVTDAVLERAGATVERVRCHQDAEFGGVPPEPDPDHLGELTDRVRSGDVDIGVVNDGDADRVAVVTPDHGYVDENLFFAVLYEYLLESDAGAAVRTVSTTFLIDRIARAHDQHVVETPVGFKWVAEAMAEHDALMGGESSGGYSVRGHVREKDGVLMALLAAAAEAKRPIDHRLASLAEAYGEIHQARLSVECPDNEKAPVMERVAAALPDHIAGTAVEDTNTEDGIKILLEDGAWLLVRPSGTEPKLRVYAEAEAESRAQELLAAGRDLLEHHRSG